MSAMIRRTRHPVPFDSKRGQQMLYRGVRWVRFTDLNMLPPFPGCYVVYSPEGHLLYVGQSQNLRSRFSAHKSNGSFPKGFTLKVRFGDRFGDWAMREARLIYRLRPPLNARVQ